MRLYRSQRFIRPDLQCHIYSNALLDNVRNLRSLCPPKTKFCAVVKANAYGHGIEEAVNILKKANVDFFAVSSIYEAIHIDSIVQDQSIFIIEAINETHSPDHISLCAQKKFHCVVSSIETLDHVTNVLAGTDDVIELHVNIETGMGRCGLAPEEALMIIEKIDKQKNTRFAGVYTHFATADEEDLTYAYKQLDNFNSFLDMAQLRGRDDIIIHAANSAATIKIPQAHFDMVRCGISMYGYYSRFMTNPPIPLKPVMKLQAPIGRLKNIPAGQSVSYGCSYNTKRDTVAAIIPLGYA
ncbi:MAG: alanine racemase, partial [Anaerohalosphaera sp.]|nr:alanine racemase [Anaerohalosphaera sp.]